MRGSLEAIRHSGAGLFFFGAVLLAMLAGFTVYGYMSTGVPTREVVVVRQDLPPGATLAASDLEIRKIPEMAVLKESITELDGAVGRRLRYGLAAGDYLREPHLVPAGSSDIAQKVASKGEAYRAVMLPGELVPGVDRLLPGDRLELTGVLPLQGERQNTTVAVPLGIATVLDIQVDPDDPAESVVLVALDAADVSKLALTLRSGALMVAVQGAGQASPAPAPLPLGVLTGADAPAAKTGN